jgi:hypothetical protein
VIEEQNVLKTTKTKPIVDAIKNRKKITFNYIGPIKPKKDSVKPGKRVKVEPVAIGLSKRGNLIIRAWVEPPSISKKGFDKTHWRTYMASRMYNVQITDEVFDSKRPDYKEGSDKSMSVTYVTSDWTKKPEIKPTEKPTKKVVTKPIPPKTKVEPEKKPAPQPKPEKKSELEPKPPKPEAKPSPPEEKPKPETPTEPEVQNKIEPEKNTEELPQPKSKEKPSKNPEEDNTLKESIKKIKHLMYS